MGSERLRKLLFKFQHFRGFVGILLAALIAPDCYPALESRERHDSICLSKRDSMPIKKILPNMKPMILAEHHPAIMAIFPHTNTNRAITIIGRWQPTA
jgi:hypothetical protein